MTTSAIVTPYSAGSYTGSRPLRVNKRTGEVQVQTGRGLTVNSLLRRDEWQLLDTEVQQSALIRLNGVQHLQSAGLTKPISSMGVLTSQWNQASEMTEANVGMTGRENGDRDRVDFKLKGVPIPMIFKEFEISTRELEAARLLGSQLDTTHVASAARVVAEKMESMLFNGLSSVVFDGNTIYGYTTETNRNTDTAANYGGGDWSTISNIVPTVEGMINAAAGDRFFGPFYLYASTTQYNEATLKRFSDGSGQTPAQFINAIPQMAGFYPSDTLADGALVLVQMTRDVVDWAQHMGVTVVEWMSDNGMVSFFRVIAVAAPRVKSEYNSRSGIVHATGA